LFSKKLLEATRQLTLSELIQWEGRRLTSKGMIYIHKECCQEIYVILAWFVLGIFVLNWCHMLMAAQRSSFPFSHAKKSPRGVRGLKG